MVCYLNINSEPTGADVYISFKKVGTTPISNYKIYPGKYNIQIKKSGYVDYIHLNYPIGEKELAKTLSVKLEEIKPPTPPKPPAITAISINSDPAGANIFIDGIDMKKTTPRQIEVVQGKREIKLTLSGYKDYRKTETITKGAVHLVKYTLEKIIPIKTPWPAMPVGFPVKLIPYWTRMKDAYEKEDKDAMLRVLRELIPLTASPMPALAVIFGIAGVIGLIVTIIGSYTFAGFIREEALQTIDFAIRTATENKDLEGLNKAIAFKEELLERTLWEKIVGAIPIATLFKELQDYYEASKVKLDIDKGTIKKLEAEVGVLKIPEIIRVYVRDVVDGDTLEVDLNAVDIITGNAVKLPELGKTGHAGVRIVGINAPEKSPKGEILCSEIEIYKVEKKYTDYARDVLLPLNDKQVLLKIDPKKTTDTYGRLLAVVEYEGKDIGLEQIKRGLACWYFREINKYVNDNLYKEETIKAQGDKKGMWSEVPEEIEEITMEPIMFTINSVPTNAKVFIDEIAVRHNTPTDEIECKDVINLFTEGKHKIRVTKGGYAAEQEITLKRGERLTLTLELMGMVAPPVVPVVPAVPVVPVVPVAVPATIQEFFDVIKTYYVGKLYMSKKELIELGSKYGLDISGLE